MMEDDPIIEILSGLYIQSLRIYDILMLTAQKLGVDVDKLEKMHEEGKTLCPDPALAPDEDEE